MTRVWAVLAAVLASLGLLTAPASASHAPDTFQIESVCTGGLTDANAVYSGGQTRYPVSGSDVLCSVTLDVAQEVHVWAYSDTVTRRIAVTVNDGPTVTVTNPVSNPAKAAEMYAANLPAGSSTLRFGVVSGVTTVALDFMRYAPPAPAPTASPTPSPTATVQPTGEPTAPPPVDPSPSPTGPAPEPSPTSSPAPPPPAVTVVRLDDEQFQRIEYVGGLLLFFTASGFVRAMSARRRG